MELNSYIHSNKWSGGERWRNWCFDWHILLIDLAYLVFWLAYSFDWNGSKQPLLRSHWEKNYAGLKKVRQRRNRRNWLLSGMWKLWTLIIGTENTLPRVFTICFYLNFKHHRCIDLKPSLCESSSPAWTFWAVRWHNCNEHQVSLTGAPTMSNEQASPLPTQPANRPSSKCAQPNHSLKKELQSHLQSALSGHHGDIMIINVLIIYLHLWRGGYICNVYIHIPILCDFSQYKQCNSRRVMRFPLRF